MMNELIECDCMDYMQSCKDKQFDIGIADFPYGIKANHTRTGFMNKTMSQNADNSKEWDNERISKDRFDEFMRICKYHVVFGQQYYCDWLPPGNGVIVWDKKNGNSVFSDCELAFQDITPAVRKFEYKWIGLFQEHMKNPEKRIHPTQKPSELYEWILAKFAKPGMSIFDPCSGSGSLRHAAYNLGFNIVSCEKDHDYVVKNNQWFDAYMEQKELITIDEIQQLTFNQS